MFRVFHQSRTSNIRHKNPACKRFCAPMAECNNSQTSRYSSTGILQHIRGTRLGNQQSMVATPTKHGTKLNRTETLPNGPTYHPLINKANHQKLDTPRTSTIIRETTRVNFFLKTSSLSTWSLLTLVSTVLCIITLTPTLWATFCSHLSHLEHGNCI
jgi:hypothetical protein